MNDSLEVSDLEVNSREGISEGNGAIFEGEDVGGGVGGRGKDGREATLTRRGEISCSGESTLFSVSVVLIMLPSLATVSSTVLSS